jgi:NAD+ synthase
VNAQIVKWLKTYAENAKVKGFVIGISGGVDSAVTSTLCAQTDWLFMHRNALHQHEAMLAVAANT